MDDGAVVLGQELKYSVGVRNLGLEHLRDEFSAADSVDGDDVGISVATQPGNNQLTMATGARTRSRRVTGKEYLALRVGRTRTWPSARCLFGTACMRRQPTHVPERQPWAT